MPDPIIVPPVVPPITDPVVTDPPAADPKAGNDEAKFRRLFEKEQADKKVIADKLTALEADAKKRADAELSELEREKQRATAAEERATKVEHDRLREKVAALHNLTADALEFLTGADEAALTANAVRLASIMKTPVTAGSVTQPSGTPAPSLDDRIATALKSGNQIQAISLLREKQFANK